MIDYNNAVFIKLKAVDNFTFIGKIGSILLADEDILFTFKGIRDGVVFTTKRIIAINIQGLTGSKVDCTSLPYSKIQAFSMETAGTFDLDSELDLWFAGLGEVRFEFGQTVYIDDICKLISEKVL